MKLIYLYIENYLFFFCCKKAVIIYAKRHEARNCNNIDDVLEGLFCFNLYEVLDRKSVV